MIHSFKTCFFVIILSFIGIVLKAQDNCERNVFLIDSLRDELAQHTTAKDSLLNYYLLSQISESSVFDTVQALAYKLQDPFFLANNMVFYANIEPYDKMMVLADKNQSLLRGTPYEGISQYIRTMSRAMCWISKTPQYIDSIKPALFQYDDSLLQTGDFYDRVEAEVNSVLMNYALIYLRGDDYDSSFVDMLELARNDYKQMPLQAHTLFELTMSSILMSIYNHQDKTKLMALVDEEWSLYDTYYSTFDSTQLRYKFMDTQGMYINLYAMMINLSDEIGCAKSYAYLQKMKKIVRQYHDPVENIYSYSFQYYQKIGAYDTALVYIDSLLNLKSLQKVYGRMATVYTNRANLNELRDSLSLALEDYRKVMLYTDSLHLWEHDHLAAELKTKLEKNTLVVKSQRAQDESFVYRVTIVAIAFILVCLLIVFFIVKRQQAVKYNAKHQRILAWERYRTMIKMSPDAIFLLNEQGDILEESASAEKRYDLKRGPKNIMAYIPEDKKEEIQALFQHLFKEPSNDTSTINLEYNHQQMILELKCRILKIHDYEGTVLMLSIRDQTMHYALMRKLLQHDRMKELGMLNTSIAHEINQPLTNISIGLDNMSEELERISLQKAKTQGREDLSSVFQNVACIEQVIDHVRLYTQNDEKLQASSIPFSLKRAVSRAMAIMGSYMEREGFILQIESDDSVPKIRGNIYRFEHVIINLLSYAMDAIELREQSRQQELKKITIKITQDDTHVYLKLSDNGRGLSEQQLRSFYKSLEERGSSGISLAIGSSIVSSMRGQVKLSSVPGQGSTFSLVFSKAECCPPS